MFHLNRSNDITQTVSVVDYSKLLSKPDTVASSALQKTIGLVRRLQSNKYVLHVRPWTPSQNYPSIERSKQVTHVDGHLHLGLAQMCPNSNINAMYSVSVPTAPCLGKRSHFLYTRRCTSQIRRLKS